MKQVSYNYRHHWIVLGLVGVAALGEWLLFDLSSSVGPVGATSLFAGKSQLLMVIVAGLAGLTYLAYCRAEQRMQHLAIERDKSRHLAEMLAAHKTCIDAHAIVSITDAKGDISYVNDKFCEISKFSRAELIGQNHRIVNSGVHDPAVFQAMYRAINTGEVWSAKLCNRAKDGSLYWVATTVMPLHNSQGQLEEIISIRTDISEIKKKEVALRQARDALEHIAYFDAMTALPNRTHCQQDLEALFMAEGGPERFAVIQIDLDKFKRVNDTLGHAAGDQLLREVGSRLSYLSAKIPDFRPYRWGGDEFIAIVKNRKALELENLCQELTDVISIPITYKDTSLWPSVSLGIAVCPDDATDLESLMMYADLALYKTKEVGRDGYHFFVAEMKEKIDSEIRIESDVRAALELDQFELYFQPQISTVDERITGIESLVRWNHPEQGQLPPGLFMDVVERFGMASALGRTIFDKAMFAARQWVDEGLDFGRLAINLSPAHLKRQTLVDDFCESLGKYQIDPGLLAVELLESVVIDDIPSQVSEIFERLARQGVHVELDDFGTGYASLGALSSLPVDGIKIDRSFVSDISSDEKQMAILEVVMSMSKLMKLRVVCEGIETQDQLRTVSKIANCSVQGYLVSRPLDLDEMTAWIRERRNIGQLAAIRPLQSQN